MSIVKLYTSQFKKSTFFFNDSHIVENYVFFHKLCRYEYYNSIVLNRKNVKYLKIGKKLLALACTRSETAWIWQLYNGTRWRSRLFNRIFSRSRYAEDKTTFARRAYIIR